MPTVSARSVSISAQLITTASVDELLVRIRDADEVSFQLNRSFNADLLKILMLSAALSRRERRLNVYFAEGGPSDGVRESLAQTLLGPVLGHLTETREGISSRDIGFKHRGYVDKQRGLFCAPTSRLDSELRERFLQDISDLMRSAGAVISENVLMRVAAMAFEPNQNAEEHGSSRIGDPSDVFRCLAARVHNWPDPVLAPLANDYIRRYVQGHIERTRWLELIVVDAGMGLAFPGFYVRARAVKSSITNVYEAGWNAERWMFTEHLCNGRSTKGHYGVSRSAQTKTGEGHWLIRRNLLWLHGYASVRAGRCLGSISYAKVQDATVDEYNRTNYEVDAAEYEMFGGTAWQLLVPLDQQLTLAL